MTALMRFISEYSYIKQETWPDKTEFSEILDSLLDESCISNLEIQFNNSILIFMGLVHLIWNYPNDPMSANVEKLIAKCANDDYQTIIYYFQGKLKSLQGDAPTALKFYRKAEETIGCLKSSDNEQLSKLLIAMGSMEDFSFADKSLRIFSTVLLIDTALSRINLGDKRGMQDLKTAIETQKIIYKTEDHPNIAYTLRLLANAYINAHEMTAALPYINSATQIAKSCYYDKSHPEFIAIMELKEQYEIANRLTYTP